MDPSFEKDISGAECEILEDHTRPKHFANTLQDEEEEGLKQGCWQKFRFFLKYSYRDVGRHKCHFCLAFFSVFIVVLSSLVVQTVVDQGPIIFVNLAQKSTCEIDVYYTAKLNVNPGNLDDPFRTSFQDLRDYVDLWHYLNYKKAAEMYKDIHNFSPRIQFNSNDKSYWQIELEPGEKLVGWHTQHWFDVEREAEIKIGTKWPTDMTADECVLSDDYKDKGFSVGDKIVLGNNQ